MTKYLVDEDGKLILSPGGRPIRQTEDVGIVDSLRINPPTVVGNNVTFSVVDPADDGVLGYWLDFYGPVDGDFRTHAFFVPAGSPAIIGTKDEVLGPFQGNSPYKGYNIGVELGDGIAPVRRKITAPAGPGIVGFSADTGDENGEIVITITPPLPSGGDGVALGDGLGVAKYVDISTDGQTWAPLGTGLLTTGQISWFGDPGVTYSISLRARSDFRAGAGSATVTAVAYRPDPSGTFPIDNGTWHTLEITAGDDLAIDFDDYISNATSYEIVSSNITGATYDSGTHVYSKTAIGTGDYTISFRAWNGANSISLSWDISVHAAIIAPQLTAAIVDQVVSIGGSLDINLFDHFSGTDLAFSVSPSNATFGLGTGANASHFKNKVALSAAFTTTSFTVTASNLAGSAEDTFTVTVPASRVAALVWDSTVDLDRAVWMFSGTTWRAPIVKFPTGANVIPGATVRPVWSTGTPDTNGDIPLNAREYMLDLGGGEWRPQMDDAARRGNPDTEVAAVSLGADPLSTTSGSNIVTVTKSAHGLTAPRTVRISDATAVGGLNIDGPYSIVSVLDANRFTIQAATNATSTATGGGSGASYQANRANYAVWSASEAGRATKLRVALEVNGIISYWSDVETIPEVSVPPPPTSTSTWWFHSRRPKAAWEATPPFVGSEGKQFEHCVCQNQGSTIDTAKANYLYFGQDENGVSFSPDGGYTIAPIVGFGLWCAMIHAIYYNSDDNYKGQANKGILLVGGGGAYNFGRCGLYGSSDEGTTFKRINLKTSNGEEVWSSPNNNTYAVTRVNINFIDRRPQNAAGTLTDAQRPIYYTAVTRGNIGSTNRSKTTGCHVFRWMDKNGDGDVFDATSWEHIYSFDPEDVSGPSSTIDGEQAVTRVQVAPNGDLLIGTRKGLYLSTNADGPISSVSFSNLSDRSVRGLNVDKSIAGVSISLSAGSVSTTSGSRNVTISKNAHGIAGGTVVEFRNLGTVNGVNLNSGRYTVAASPGANSFVVTALTNASATGSGGAAGTVTNYATSGCYMGISDQANGVDCVWKTSNVRTGTFSAPANNGIPANSGVWSLQGVPYNFQKVWITTQVSSGPNKGLYTTDGGANWSEVSVNVPPGYSSEAWRFGWGDRPPGIYPHPRNQNRAFGVTRQSVVYANSAGATTFNGSVFFDHAHAKGWSYDRSDWRRILQFHQDGGGVALEPANDSNGVLRPLAYRDFVGVGHSKTATKTSGGSGTIKDIIAAAADATFNGATGGQAAVALHGSDMHVWFEGVSSGYRNCVPIVTYPTGSDPYGNRRVRDDLGASLMPKQFHHPTREDAIIVGKWFISGWTKTQTLGNNPLSTVSGGKTVTVTAAGHGLTVGRRVDFPSKTVGGITISGAYIVKTVPDSSHFTIQASANASSTTDGGGSGIVITKPNDVDSISFATRSNREVLGYSYVDGNLVWYMGNASRTATGIYRSTDDMGAGPSLWKTVTEYLHVASCPNPHVADCFFYTPSDDGRDDKAGSTLRRIKVSGGSTTDEVILDIVAYCTSLYATLGISTDLWKAPAIGTVVADPNQPGVLYVSTNTPGMPVVLRTTNCNAAANAIVWENITGNLPHTSGWLLSVHDITGEICLTSSMGEYWRAAPDTYPTTTKTSPARAIVKNAFTASLKAFYDRDDVPDQPILPSIA